MISAGSFRSRARVAWRALWPFLVVVGGAVTCDNPLAPRPAVISIRPLIDLAALKQFAGLTIDQARITVVRPPAETLAQRTFPFSVDSTQLSVSIDVTVTGTENLNVIFELLAGTQLIFTGSQTVAVTAGNPTPPTTTVTPTFVGPGSQIGSLLISPRDSGAAFNAMVPFSVTARDSSNNPVATFYASWSTSSTAHTINATGLFRSGNARGVVWVYAETPSGIKDSTRITVAPVASALQIASGNGQSGSPGSPLPLPLVARVIAQDNGPVVGFPVTFAVGTGGGSVTPASVTTDSLGQARATATLGGAGNNTYIASAAGLTPVTFTATASVASIQLSLTGNLVGVGMTGQLTITLTQPAPAGGLTVTVTSDSTQYLTVAAPGTVTIAAGGTSGTITLNGVAAGVSFIRATATGYGAGLLPLGVLPPTIALQSGLSVAVGASTSMQVQLIPAPNNPTTVTVVSGDPALLTITTATVNFTAGQSAANATIQGVAAGAVGVTATATGYLPGGAVVTVTGGSPVATTLQKVVGDSQTAFINDTTALRLQARVLDQTGAAMAGASVLFTIGSGGGTIGGTSAVSATTNASGIATATQWRMGGTVGTNTVIASIPSAPGVTAQTFTATAQLPPPVIVLSIFGSNVVGQARSGQLDVRLLQAAPAGGVTVTLTSTRTGLLRIGTYTSENGSAAFLQGDTLKAVVVFGDSSLIGTDTVIATAPGYAPDTLAVPVSQNLISLPTTLNVSISQTASLPINLSVPAPAGGVLVTLTSSDSTVVRVTTPTVTVPAGLQVASATVQGMAIGSANVTATNPNFAPDVSAVGVTAALNIVQTGLTLNQSFGLPLTVRLESGGTPIAAPAGGVAFTITSANPTCAAAPASGLIPAGLQSVNFNVTYGGSASTPCTSFLRVDGPPGFTIDSLNVSVQPTPAITIGTISIGSGLARVINLSLNASNHGGTTVQITSPDPSKVRLSADDSTAGTASVNIPVGIGVTFVTFYVQAMEGLTADTVLLTATATGFVTATPAARVWQAVLDLSGLSGSANTQQANDPFTAYIGTPVSPTGTSVNTVDEIRPGGVPIAISFVNDSVAVGDLQTTALTADSVTLTLGIRRSQTPGNVALGGVAFDYVAAGTAQVRAHAPGYRSVGGALGQSVIVTAPAITITTTVSVGSGLQRPASVFIPVAAPAGGVPITIIKSKPGLVLLNTDDTTAGVTDTLVVTIPQAATGATFYIQALEGITADTVRLFASSPGYTSDSSTVRVWQPVLDLSGLIGSGNTQTANDPFIAFIGTPNTPSGTFVNTQDEIRPGGVPITVSFVNDSAAVGDLQTTALTADSVTVAIGPRQAQTPTSVATGGVAFDYVAAGIARVRADAPGYRSVSSALGQNVTVTAPAITTTTTVNIGSGLQRVLNVNIPVAAPAGGVPITIIKSKPGLVLLSTNDSTAGVSDTLVMTIPQGSSSVFFYVQALEGITADTLLLILSSPGYTSDTSNVRVWQAVFDVSGLLTTLTTLAANDPFIVFIGTPSSPTGTFVNTSDPLRAGGPGATFTISSSTSSTAQLVSTARSGDTVTVALAPRQSQSPGTVATGGASIDPLSTGTTVIRTTNPGMRAVNVAVQQTVTVTAPLITVSAPATVGAGLQTSGSVSLSDGGHGGVDVVVRSSNPAIALVSSNVSTLGDSVITVQLLNGQTSFTIYVHGVEGQAGTVSIRATAPGFTDGLDNSSIVQPGLQIGSLIANTPAATADDPFTVSVGVPNAGQTGLSLFQSLRAGGPGLTVSLQSTVPAAGGLTVTGQTNQPSVTVLIAEGQNSSPSTVALGGVAFDFIAAGTTFVVPTATGFLTMQQSVPPQLGLRVIVTP